MSARLAAELGLLLMAVGSAFAWRQVARGGLDLISRVGLAVNLFGLSVLWLRTDKPVEGLILLRLGPDHGLTAADTLVAVPAYLCLRLTGVLQFVRVSARENRR